MRAASDCATRIRRSSKRLRRRGLRVEVSHRPRRTRSWYATVSNISNGFAGASLTRVEYGEIAGLYAGSQSNQTLALGPGVVSSAGAFDMPVRCKAHPPVSCFFKITVNAANTVPEKPAAKLNNTVEARCQ